MPPQTSLAALLGELNTAAPKDFDPEAGYDHSEAQSTASDSDDDPDHFRNPTAHYLDVDHSQLRRKSNLSEHETLRQPKYQGVKVTRDQLYPDHDQDQDGEQTSEGEDRDSDQNDESIASESGSGQDEDQDDDQDDLDDFADLIRGPSSSASGNPKPTSKKTLRFAEQPTSAAAASGSGSSSSGGEDDDHDGNDPADGSNTLAAQLKQSQKLAKQLKARRIEDAEKGRNVRKQIRLWERSLEARIKAQSAMRNLNQLPDPAVLSDLVASSSSTAVAALATTLEELLGLSDRLFELRTALHAVNEPADGSGSGPTLDPGSRKRKRPSSSKEGSADPTSLLTSLGRSTDDDVLSASISDLLSFETQLDATRRPILEKWSHKVSSAAASASSSSSNANKFALKAVNQSPVAQIDAAMSGDGYDRLLERTRVRRTDDSTSKISLLVASPSVAPPPASTSTSRHLDPEIFDDTDFYSFLLRDLIERRSGPNGTGSAGGSSSSLTTTELFGASGRKAGRRGGVDTKASKGRRLRYDVNERVVSFMPPVPSRVGWSEEQVERLFRQLAGGGSAGDGSAEEGEGEAGGEVELEGLRVFG